MGKTAILQDGDPVIAENGEQFIRVHFWTRYYGPGYERGNFPVIYSTALWLRARLPDAQIWYGGDSSGICDVPMLSCGGGRDLDFWRCDGCNAKAVAFADGRPTVHGTDRDDFSTLAHPELIKEA